MDIDDDDDFYGPDETEIRTEQPIANSTVPANATSVVSPAVAKPAVPYDVEDSEDKEEAGEMEQGEPDVDITAHRDKSNEATIPTSTQSKYSEIRNIPSRTAKTDALTPSAPPQDEAKHDAVRQQATTVELNPNPVYKPVGKPIMSINIDEDLADKDKPWRKPGTDLSDYFNYGFDEFSWVLYADKQSKLRNEYNQEAVQERTKKMMEDMNNMMMGGMSGMTGMGGMGGGSMTASAPNMQGMEGMPPEMQAMMQQMMASGMDQSQMDPATLAAMFGNQAAAAGGGGGGAQGAGQNQNFGAQGFGGSQNQGYGGYDQGGGQRGGFGGGRGNRGIRRNW